MCPFRLALDINSITKLNLTPTQVPDWVQLMIQCRLTAQNPQGKNFYFSNNLFIYLSYRIRAYILY